MVRAVGRKLLWAYALLMLLAAVGYARYDTYIMDGDGTAFLDIAQDLNTHHAALAINGYWNPGYPAVVALAERVAHPTLWRELALVRFTNVLIFAAAMAACVFFTSALVRARELRYREPAIAVAAPAIHLLGLSLLTLSLGRELPVAAPRADTLLFALLMLAGGLVLRLLTRPRLWLYPLLGLVLGCAYLTKSFAFLPSIALFLVLLGYGAFQLRSGKLQTFLGAGLALLVFALVAGPYIAAISRQLGHFSTGESARLNYAFFIDMTPRWHEWFHHDLGHAGGTFLHAEAPLAAQPPVFSYAAHPVGTYPLWFDPAWWTLGIKPQLWLGGHLYRLARNVALLFRYLLGRPEIFVLLAVMIAFGATWPHFRKREPRGSRAALSWNHITWFLTPVLWGLLMLAIYFPVDLQDRYLTAPLFLIVLPLFAALRVVRGTRHVKGEEIAVANPTAVYFPVLASALVLLFAGFNLVQAANFLADRRRHIPLAEQRHAGFDPQIFTAAAGLEALGVRPGDKVACMGDLACYTDFYWARLAGTQILGEIETPNEANPITVWNDIPDKANVTVPLTRLGLRYIVSLFPNSASKPAGWVQLGQSNFFAYPLQDAISPEQAARVAALTPTP